MTAPSKMPFPHYPEVINLMLRDINPDNTNIAPPYEVNSSEDSEIFRITYAFIKAHPTPDAEIVESPLAFVVAIKQWAHQQNNL